MTKLSALTFLLVLLVFGSTTSCAQKQKPEDFANRFYQSYLKLNMRGLPDEQELKSLSPFLSEDLRLLFEKAKLKQKQFIAENPDDMKPPWIEGDMFTSLFEGAQFFKIGKVKTRGVYTDVSVDLEYEENGETSRWTDTLVLIKTKEGWRVWDILLNGDWEFKAGSNLRHMLGAEN
ncbi:MAG TPA: hypothetical protein VK308_00470 [Pyrinomonadaceae bacterium]|nr:hypothetical protein [Pyrinomonadaceae bacterium]